MRVHGRLIVAVSVFCTCLTTASKHEQQSQKTAPRWLRTLFSDKTLDLLADMPIVGDTVHQAQSLFQIAYEYLPTLQTNHKTPPTDRKQQFSHPQDDAKPSKNSKSPKTSLSSTKELEEEATELLYSKHAKRMKNEELGEAFEVCEEHRGIEKLKCEKSVADTLDLSKFKISDIDSWRANSKKIDARIVPVSENPRLGEAIDWNWTPVLIAVSIIFLQLSGALARLYKMGHWISRLVPLAWIASAIQIAYQITKILRFVGETFG